MIVYDRKDDGLDFIRRMPCLVCGNQSQAHHVKTRGAGGRDEFNTVPLCVNHHTGPQGVHFLGRMTFERTFNVNLQAEARRIWEART